MQIRGDELRVCREVLHTYNTDLKANLAYKIYFGSDFKTFIHLQLQ